MLKKHAKTAKQSKDKHQSLIEPPVQEQIKPREESLTNQKHGCIKITLESYQNIVGFFPISDIKTELSYDGRTIGETTWTCVTDDEYLSIDETLHLNIDINSIQELDRFISTPIIVTVSQSEGIFDKNLYHQLRNVSPMTTSAGSIESIVSEYEPIPEEKPESSLNLKSTSKLKKGKSKTKNKAAKKLVKVPSPTSESSLTDGGDAVFESAVETKEIERVALVYGVCAIDCLPLFYGNTSFSETMLIKPIRKYNNVKSNAYDTIPKLIFTIATEEKINSIDTNILNFTVESIYNIPSLMTPDMDYKIRGMIPLDDIEKCSMLFTNPQYTLINSRDLNRCWPGKQNVGLNANTTKYKPNQETEDLLCKVEDDIIPYLAQDNPKLQFNMIKRNFMHQDGINRLAAHIKTHCNFVLEFYMTTKATTTSSTKMSSARGRDKSRKGKSASSLKSITDMSSATLKKSKPQPYLHLMAILDLSSLLYPGVQKVRLACPLATFTKEDARARGDLQESYFASFIEEVPSPITHKKAKASKREKRTESSSKSSNKVKSREDSDGDHENIADTLPEPVPSQQVFDENGRPCFIIVEIELTKSIISQLDLEDLEEDFHQLLKKTGEQTAIKVIVPPKNCYKELLNEIIEDMNVKFQMFLEENPQHKVRTYKTPSDFVKFLQSIGTYQSYLNRISEVTIRMVEEKDETKDFDLHPESSKKSGDFIADLFVHLVSETNDTLNQLVCHGMEPQCEEGVSNKHFFFAKEAMEMRKHGLAESYLLERIRSDTQNPNYWFDYGVYFLEMKYFDKAFDCMREALMKDPIHRHSLMALGILLDIDGRTEEAEKCFLVLTMKIPRWLEGWTVLYIFYKKHNNHEGIDVTLGKAKRYLDDKQTPKDYFTYFEDLAWTYKFCPRTVFFRTAVLLLKMRIYDWAEMALSEEIESHYGLVKYLLSVICYYKGLYNEALKHLEEAKTSDGSNYAIAALSGHCLLALNQNYQAKQEYYYALTYSNRPDDIHLVYLNCSKLLESIGDYNESIKLILLACKYSPSPYTWLKAGILYFRTNDLLKSEECLQEGNSIDHRHEEVWGYLCLVNLKLNRPHEAELCYLQAINNKLEDSEILEEIKKEFLRLRCNVEN